MEKSKAIQELDSFIERNKNKLEKSYHTQFTSNNSNTVLCSCGCGAGVNHIVGIGNCYRYHITNESEIPKNRRLLLIPKLSKEPIWVWDIDNDLVPEYTLFNQRYYSVDERGNWTRPKTKDSINSLEGDW